MKIKGLKSYILCVAANILLVYIGYQICRVEYLLDNYAVFRDNLNDLNFSTALKGSLFFDTSAIVYTNLIYIILSLLPFRFRENFMYQKITKLYYVIVNGLCFFANMADSVYFVYTNRRTTCSVFAEFSNDMDKTGGILFSEIVSHWYLIILLAAMIFGLWKLYFIPNDKTILENISQKIKYYTISLLTLALVIPLCIGGARGGFSTAIRPITISNANQYVNRPTEASLILNTPFAILRTIGKKNFKVPTFFPEDEVEKIFSPLHKADLTKEIDKKNVVVFILESFSREFCGFYNKTLDNGTYKGFTPFLDSLMEHSLTFDYTFANGRKSIDGMPSSLSSIPYFVEPFFLTPYSLNKLSGLARELKNFGYYSAFFHGAQNGSMGFQAFAASTGYDNYFGREDFDLDTRFDGEKAFDGTWSIWDEDFLQYYAVKMSEFPQPFLTSVFTASSHHPFKVPEKYSNIFVDKDQNPLHKCVLYSDNALRNFFNTAKKTDWFKNTIFVFTADHTNQLERDFSLTDLGLYSITFFIYDPSGKIQPELRHAIAQQIDIMPTVLSYVGYDKDYIAFGDDLLSMPDEKTRAVNYNNGLYQYFKGDYMIQMTEDGNLKSVYKFKQDSLLRDNLIKEKNPQVDILQTELKALVQSYMQRMTQDQLTIEK
ncbi:MAG: LTA synthase family protein [Bacteroidales bacterium]|nr:LTA synthase family protein [Bacteroidales bacterium]